MPEHNKNNSQGMPMGGPGMGGTSEKAENFTSSIKKLLLYKKSYLPLMGMAILMAVLGSILNVIGPDYLSKITDLITDGLFTGIDVDAVVKIAVFLAVLYGLGFLFSVLQGILMSDTAQKISRSLRSDLDEKINRLPLKYFDSHSLGNILSRITNDVDTVSQSLTQSLSTSVTAVTMLIGALVMMYYTNWIMATAAVLSSLAGFAFMMVIITRSQKYFTRQQNELGKINGHIEENYAGHNVVCAYNGVRKAKQSFDEMNGRLYASAWKSQFLSGLMQPLMGFIGNFGYVVVCVTGAVLAMNDTITFGVIVAFMAYIRLFTQPLSQIAQVATSLQSAAAASERVFDFLEEEEMTSDTGSQELSEVKGTIRFDHVKFAYQKDRPIIRDFSAQAAAGQKIAIVGPTGAGKTTMVNLLMRFYEVNSGRICIDGVDIADMSRGYLRSLFGMVLQDTWLFHGTIRENIVYNKTGVTQAELDEACHAVGLYHFIQTLPHGYDTMLDDNANLSAGQKQLVTIARAMIEDAPMLILDEATSSVDTRTEVLIQKAMDRLMAGRTSFIIAHRLSTIRNANLILVMRDGDIIESGTHEELMEDAGFYADLYNSQFEGA